jgi:hypothetical protein
MGVVHLGTVISPAGERRVAIKRVLAKGEDDEEARLNCAAVATKLRR